MCKIICKFHSKKHITSLWPNVKMSSGTVNDKTVPLTGFSRLYSVFARSPKDKRTHSGLYVKL